METKDKQVTIGNLKCNLQSECYGMKLLDTKVIMEGGTLCWIAGPEINDFLKEINDVIQKYRI